MEVYAAGVALLGLGWLYSESQKPLPPPVTIRDTDSQMISIDLMQKKAWLYGGNPTSNLPLGLQQRKLPNYDGLSHNQILQAVRQDYSNTVNDQSLIPNVVAKAVHGGQIVQPTGQNGFNIQTLMQPSGSRSIVVEPYSRSGLPSNTTALSTTGLGQ